MPRGFKVVNYDFDLLVPLAFDPVKQMLAGFAYRGIARLRPGVTISQADADVARLLNVWMDSWTNGPGIDPHFYQTWKITPALRPLKDQVVGSVGNVLWVVMATIGVVMLIACTNVANLLLVRADGRQHELAVRSALGAGRWRIARELLLESVTLGLLGGAVGMGVAYAGLRPVDGDWAGESAASERDLARRPIARIHPDPIGALRTAIRLYSGAALRSFAASRAADRRDANGKREPRAAARTQPAGRGAGSDGAGAAHQRGADDPYLRCDAQRRSGLLRSRIAAGDAHFDSGDAGSRSADGPADSEQHPGQACRDSRGFLRGLRRFRSHERSRTELGRHLHRRKKLCRRRSRPCACSTMSRRAISIPPARRLVAGRDFAWTDIYGLRPVGMLSESLARELWGSPSAAIGKRFREFPSMPWHEVIGVVQDVRENGVDQISPATVYWPSLMHDLYGPGSFDARRTVYFRDAQQSRRDASLHQRDAAGRLVGEFESAGGIHQHHAGYL